MQFRYKKMDQKTVTKLFSMSKPLWQAMCYTGISLPWIYICTIQTTKSPVSSIKICKDSIHLAKPLKTLSIQKYQDVWCLQTCRVMYKIMQDIHELCWCRKIKCIVYSVMKVCHPDLLCSSLIGWMIRCFFFSCPWVT